MPGGSGGPSPGESQRPGKEQILPQIQKNQKVSTVILKYMEGITKRVGKISDACLFICFTTFFPRQNVS